MYYLYYFMKTYETLVKHMDNGLMWTFAASNSLFLPHFTPYHSIKHFS